MRIIRKKSQASLESTIAFLAGTILLGAGMAIWAWGTNHIGNRQIPFTMTRLIAGQPLRMVDENGAQETGGPGSIVAGKPLVYPVYSAQTRPLP